MGGIIQDVGDGGSNRDKSMRVRDAEFKKHPTQNLAHRRPSGD